MVFKLSKIKLSRKRLYILAGLVFLLIVIWTIDFFSYIKKQPRFEERVLFDCKDVGREAFLIKEESGKTIVSSQENGLRLEIPGDWKTDEQYNETEIDFFDSNAKLDNPIKDAKTGSCAIAIQLIKCNKIDKFSTYADQTRTEIDIIKDGKGTKSPTSELEKELFLVGQHEGIKYSSKKNDETKNIRIWLPINNDVYVFDSGIIFDNKCIDKFNEITKTLTIYPHTNP